MKIVTKASYHDKNSKMNEIHKHYALLEKRILFDSNHPFVNTLKWSF